jgi:hypothetical protein
MPVSAHPDAELPREAAAVYRTGVAALVEAGIPFLVGGAYALKRYTGIHRHTKDLDIFVRPSDVAYVLDTLDGAGFRTELPFPHWLGKAYGDADHFIDVIFRSGNGMAVVDDAWFQHSLPGEVLGLWLPVCPAEEMIWSKSFVAERERFDGADVLHLLHALAESLNWDRLLWRFGEHWRVLLAQLTMFGYVYPGERGRIPIWVMEDLGARLSREVLAATPSPDERACRGTLLSREQYLIDIQQWGYEDARLGPEGHMTAHDIDLWTEAIHGRRATYEHTHADDRRRR